MSFETHPYDDISLNIMKVPDFLVLLHAEFPSFTVSENEKGIKVEFNITAAVVTEEELQEILGPYMKWLKQYGLEQQSLWFLFCDAISNIKAVAPVISAAKKLMKEIEEEE